jgi:hypothetical protein
MQESDDKIISIEDDALGLIENINTEDFLKPYQLSNIEVEQINSTRINKDTYPVDCKLKYGHVREGVEIVERLIRLSYDYYLSISENSWKPVDFKDYIIKDYYEIRVRTVTEQLVIQDVTIRADQEFIVEAKLL